MCRKAKTKQQNRLQGWHTIDKPINSAHIFQGTIRCQINDKYNPTYCLVLQLGIDRWSSATVQVFTASVKPLSEPDFQIERWKHRPGFPDYIFVTVSHEEVFISGDFAADWLTVRCSWVGVEAQRKAKKRLCATWYSITAV